MGGIPPVRHGLLILQISITAAYKSTPVPHRVTVLLFTSKSPSVSTSTSTRQRGIGRGRLPQGMCTCRSMHHHSHGCFLNPGVMLFNISDTVCGWHCVAGTVASLQERQVSIKGAFLCGVCMVFQCLYRFSPSTPVSSYSLKTCGLGQLAPLNCSLV